MVKLEATKEHDDGRDVTVTVAPALPVQEHRLPLSNLDLLLPPLDVSLFFCYLHPAPTAAALKEALAKTLVAYYPLAGEVVANGDGEPELLCSGRGVDFTETTAAGVELREVRLGAVDEGVEKLVPAKKAGVMAVKVCIVDDLLKLRVRKKCCFPVKHVTRMMRLFALHDVALHHATSF